MATCAVTFFEEPLSKSCFLRLIHLQSIFSCLLPSLYSIFYFARSAAPSCLLLLSEWWKCSRFSLKIRYLINLWERDGVITRIWSFPPGVDPTSVKRKRDQGLPAENASGFRARSQRAVRVSQPNGVRGRGKQGGWKD